ncbi:ABC transporter substrate-binding protein [Pseudonocardia pini]|uniref:ABC transporter substrate-binding protein n=1 Tax=Pseudonocardia pini TaxID=2758030 RepID=UPI0015F0A4D4|nr:ABC transporter substrate-binding protein [Pseudonocardia pini]
MIVSLGAAVVLAVTAACGGGQAADSAGPSGEPLRILLLAPISAPALANNATTEINAAKAAVEVINKNGGVLGRPIELDVQDEANSPTTAVTKLNTALSGDAKPSVLVQTDASPITSAVLPLSNQNKIVALNFAQTADSGNPAKYPYSFDLAASTASIGAAFCAQMQSMNVKSFAIIRNDTPFANAETDEVTKQCQAAGLTLTGAEKFATSTLDVTPQLSALQATNPEVLVFFAYGAPSGYVLQGVNRLGWNVPLLGDGAVIASPVVTSPPPAGMLDTEFEANLKAMAYASTVYKADQPQPVTDLISGMKAAGGIPAPLTVAYAYDAVVLAAAGAEAAGTTTDGAKIAAAIEALPPGGPKTAIFSSYTFSPTSHSANPDPTEFAFIKPTKLVDGQFGNPSAS